LILDLERLGQPARDRVLRCAYVDPEPACRWVCQEHAPEQFMMLGPHGAALRQALDALGAPAAGAVKCEPMAAGLEPGFQANALLVAGVGAGDVGDEEPVYGPHFLQDGKVISDGCRNSFLVQQREEPKTSIVVVVTGMGARRNPAGNDVRAVVDVG